MANELKIFGSMAFSKGDANETRDYGPLTIDVAGEEYIKQWQTAPSNAGSATALNLGSVTTPGYLFVKNLDATNGVDFFPSDPGDGASDAGVPNVPPGGIGLWFANNAIPYIRCDAAATAIIEYFLVEA